MAAIIKTYSDAGVTSITLELNERTGLTMDGSPPSANGTIRVLMPPSALLELTVVEPDEEPAGTSTAVLTLLMHELDAVIDADARSGMLVLESRVAEPTEVYAFTEHENASGLSTETVLNVLHQAVDMYEVADEAYTEQACAVRVPLLVLKAIAGVNKGLNVTKVRLRIDAEGFHAEALVSDGGKPVRRTNVALGALADGCCELLTQARPSASGLFYMSTLRGMWAVAASHMACVDIALSSELPMRSTFTPASATYASARVITYMNLAVEDQEDLYGAYMLARERGEDT